jgi:serine/threonine-protein kinase
MRRIGRYEILGLLGRGGMGAVYKVRLPALGRVLALKRLDPRPELTALWGPANVRNRFIREARIMGRLRHPFLTAVYDFVDDPLHPFFVMDYYCRNLGVLIGEGRDLDAAARVPPPQRTFRYVRQTLSGLERLHQAGLVHRDIKPFNLLLSDEDDIRIADFGLSRLRGEAPWKQARLRVGSPYYAAPEQERTPDDAGPESDLYSAGILVHRLLTGRLPIRGIEPVPGWPAVANQALAGFFDKALHPSPSGRFPSASAMAQALGDVEAQWARSGRPECGLLFGGDDPSPAPRPPLRAHARKVTPDQAPSVFGLDALNRPRSYSSPRLEPVSAAAAKDSTTGLFWDLAGPGYGVSWDEAGDYVRNLADQAHGGYSDWRRPTVPELLSLLGPPDPSGSPCVPDGFGGPPAPLWSADTRSALAAWMIDTELGFTAPADKTCLFGVRAVRG